MAVEGEIDTSAQTASMLQDNKTFSDALSDVLAGTSYSTALDPDADALAQSTSTTSAATAPGAIALGSSTSLVNGEGLTKSAAKRLAKRARLEAVKKDRKIHDREKKKARKAALKEQVENAKKEGKDVDPELMARLKKAAGTTKRVQQTPFKAKIVVDLGFDELMTDSEVSSMAQQVAFVYAENQKAANPFEEILMIGHGMQRGGKYATSGEPTQDAVRAGYGPGVQPESSASAANRWPSIVDTRVGRHLEVKMNAAWRSWKRVRIVDRGGLEALWDSEVASEAISASSVPEISIAETSSTSAAPSTEVRNGGKGKRRAGSKQWWSGAELGSVKKEDIIYLTADTTDTVSELEEGKVYIIGGIVDRNRHKELCARKAAALGIRVARLPIDPANLLDGLSMRARKVLTVNQVFEILCAWNTSRDWKAALGKGLPMRKYNESEKGREKEASLKGGGGMSPRVADGVSEGTARVDNEGGKEGEERGLYGGVDATVEANGDTIGGAADDDEDAMYNNEQ